MRRILLPVAESPTLEDTITYVAEAGVRDTDAVRFRVIFLPQLRATPLDAPAERGDTLLNRVATLIEETTQGATAAVSVETEIVEATIDLYTPIDVAEILLEQIETYDIDQVQLDPSYGPPSKHGFVHPVERILREESTAMVEIAPFDPTPGILPGRLDVPRTGFIFTLSFLFYLVLAGGISTYGLVTGAITAGIVTITLGAITLWFPPRIRYTPIRFLRAFIYIPYLLIAITRANLDVSRVILHPKLPIDPRVVRYHPAVYGPFPLATLGNSITLTPGTLSMRIERGELLVHTLTEDARTDLIEGGLERAVRFLFFGRRAMRVASPGERGDITVSEPLESGGEE